MARREIEELLFSFLSPFPHFPFLSFVFSFFLIKVTHTPFSSLLNPKEDKARGKKAGGRQGMIAPGTHKPRTNLGHGFTGGIFKEMGEYAPS